MLIQSVTLVNSHIVEVYLQILLYSFCSQLGCLCTRPPFHLSFPLCLDFFCLLLNAGSDRGHPCLGFYFSGKLLKSYCCVCLLEVFDKCYWFKIITSLPNFVFFFISKVIPFVTVSRKLDDYSLTYFLPIVL